MIKRKKISLVFSCILVISSFNIIFQNWFINQNFGVYNDFEEFQKDTEKENLRLQDLTRENSFNGIGAPLNLTHWANRTDKDLSLSFSEGSYDITSIPLGTGWEGTKLNATINDLTDERNWNNGTFNFGNDNGTDNAGEDDSDWIKNEYQNWTFGYNDTGQGNNLMSGNYLNNIGGQDCLELRLDGDNTVIPQWYTYDPQDECWWNSTINIPRGRVIDSKLKFNIYPDHLMRFNSWAFAVYINNLKVYSIGTFSLWRFGSATWHSFTIPQKLWTNSSRVFPIGPINETLINIRIVLESLGGGNYNGFMNQDFQRLYFDNVELITKTEALPSNLQLTINQTTNIQDIGWGKGQAEMEGNWQFENIYVNFSSEDISKLGSYKVELKTDLNLYVQKHTPETNFETDSTSIGTKFYVNNASVVNWEFYAFIAVPTLYSETEMKLEIPNDFNITSVFEPQNPSTNIIDLCNNSTIGVLSIPIDDISSTPDGFWKFEAISPNYFEDLINYNNVTGSWVRSTEFLSGEYVNITAKIKSSPVIANYIQYTKAYLQIRFPNGSIWMDKNQFVQLDSNGYVHFKAFKIPDITPNYEIGYYQAIVTWNNSYATNGINETGIIYKTFAVKHYSKLTPEHAYYKNNIEGTPLNIKIYYNDFETFDAIENATIYMFNFTNPSIPNYFDEISPGFYLLEFNSIGAKAGNNTITIFANSPFYASTEVNITIQVIKQTNLIADNDFITNASYKSNFTIYFSYAAKFTGEGIDADTLSTDWDGDFQFIHIAQGRYALICNASGPGIVPVKLFTLIINIGAKEFIPQSIPVRILINELDTHLELYFNGIQRFEDELLFFEYWEQVNITVKYKDAQQKHLNDAIIKVMIGESIIDLKEYPSIQQYSAILNVSEIGQGIYYLFVVANLTYYTPSFIRTILQITERTSELTIFFNDINKSIDPTIEIPIGTILNLTINYQDSQGIHIDEAEIRLSGDFSVNLIENTSFNHYSVSINTSELNVGVKLLTLIAEKENYQFQSEDLRIEIRPINVEISTLGGELLYVVKPGDDIKLKIILNNTDFGDLITGAEVKYTWNQRVFDLKDIDGDGIYEGTLKNIPSGSFSITILGFAGDEYIIKSLKITVTAVSPKEDVLIFQIILISTIILTISLATYLVLYQKVLRFPKQVRKVRKYRKTLSRKSAPKGNIISREQAFKDLYKEEFEKVQRLKVKPAESMAKVEKTIEKKPIEKPEDLGKGPIK